jgi:hypothetical protein
MVQIYYEITIYIYKEIFPSGGLAPGTPQGGNPQTLQGGKSPLQPPAWRGVFQGVKSSWGINMAENKDL